LAITFDHLISEFSLAAHSSWQKDNSVGFESLFLVSAMRRHVGKQIRADVNKSPVVYSEMAVGDTVAISKIGGSGLNMHLSLAITSVT
jgi:hypothetical protein